MSTQQKERNGAAAVAESAKETASRAGDLMKDTASTVAQKTREVVKDAATTVADKTGEAASYVGHKADDASAAVGKEMESLGNTIRSKGPQEGVLGNAGAAVASTLESCGKELESGVSGMAEDLTNTIRRHPVPAILVGVGVGFLIAHYMLKSQR